MFNPDEKDPVLAPIVYELDDFWFKSYPGLTLWQSKLHIEIDEDTNEWYLHGFEITNGTNEQYVDQKDWLFSVLRSELNLPENEDLRTRIHEACVEAGREA